MTDKKPEKDHVHSRTAVDYALTAAKHNFVSLTSNADQKANIIIAITSVIFTVSIGQIADMNQEYQASLIVLMIFSLISLLLAIVSVTPNYHSGKKGVKLPPSDALNYMFFGHISQMSFTDYKDAMTEKLNNDEQLYDMLLKDMYQMGGVLHRDKFRFLYLSYRFFFAGLVLTCIITMAEVIYGLSVG